jgi:ABC-2 type transport system ATP-binding protein
LILQTKLERIPPELGELKLELSNDGAALTYTFDSQAESTGIASLLRHLNELGIHFKDLNTTESSLEDIFVNLVRSDA